MSLSRSLLKHLQEDHHVDTVELGEWLLDYADKYPDMAVIQHVWHMHDVIHHGEDDSKDHPETLHDFMKDAKENA